MRIRETVRRAFASFLALPTAVIACFGLLAIGTYWLDRSGWTWLEPIRDFMRDHVFGSEQSTANLLATIAGGVITITSITFSLLLLALQQSAGALTHDVFDQFLRRRANQVYFGFFVGLTLYSLIVLISVDPPFNPVIGASLALVLTIVALYILLLLIYACISQMRPNEIVRAIHDMTLKARDRQQPLIMRTRRSATFSQMPATVVRASRDGFVSGIDLDAIATGLDQARGSVEVSYLQSIGSYVAFQDPIAEIRGERGEELAALGDCVAGATAIRQDRDVDTDPAYGIDQLATIAWRSISTSQQNPSPGIAAVNALHDLLARWSSSNEPERDDPPLPDVYLDNVMASAFGALESLTVVASESMQHQTYAAILNAIAVLFERLCPAERQRAEDLVLRSLSGLGDQILTRALDDALAALAESLDEGGALDTARAVRVARNQLAESIGRLNSRSTRVPQTM
jgi:hypothetical protein